MQVILMSSFNVLRLQYRYETKRYVDI